ncbi:MAG: dTDP-4-dehydrorhamnose 3,5-epimerase family protein [Capsulimonadaceae bacterium]
MITTQEYGGAPRIEGVQWIDLRLLTDDGGSFAELIRIDERGCMEALPTFRPRQSSFSMVLPGAVKAFHLHFNQEDVWFVPPDHRLLVGLIDARKDSTTCGNRMRIVMGGGRARLLYIPRGVAHGGANIGTEPSMIIYFVNQQFSLDDPDERRLPWDIAGEDFWKMIPG